MQSLPPVQPNTAAIHRALPLETARRLLRRDAYPNLVRLLRKLHGSECAELLGHLTQSEQIKALERLPDLELATTIFTYLDEETRDRLLPQLSTARLVGMVRLLPPDDATQRLAVLLAVMPLALLWDPAALHD